MFNLGAKSECSVGLVPVDVILSFNSFFSNSSLTKHVGTQQNLKKLANIKISHNFFKEFFKTSWFEKSTKKENKKYFYTVFHCISFIVNKNKELKLSKLSNRQRWRIPDKSQHK